MLSPLKNIYLIPNILTICARKINVNQVRIKIINVKS
jgi:hypothetical protein